MQPPNRYARIVLAIAATAAAMRVGLAAAFWGFHTGDDVELLEEAMRRALGLAYHPWPIRNLLLPDVLMAPAVGDARHLGVVFPRWLVLAATVPLVALATMNVWLVWRLARRWGVDEPVACLAAAVYAFHWLPLAYGSMPYPRTAVVTCLLGAALALASGAPPLRRGAAAGALLAVALAARYSAVVFLVPAALLAAGGGSRREGRRALTGLALGFAAGVLVAVGLVDALTWGRPFASLLAFARYIFVDHASSSRVAVQPPWFYLARLLFWVPLPALPLLAAARGSRAARAGWVFLVVPVLLLSAVYHKELRYLQGVVPFLAILVALGAGRLVRGGRRRTAAVLVALTLAVGLWNAKLVAGTSLAAVGAAERLARDGRAHTVVLSQAWAYGDRIVLGNGVAVRDVATPPRPAELRAALEGADAACVYADDLGRDPELRAALAGAGFVEEGTFRRWSARSVVVFAAGRGAGPGSPVRAP